MSDMHDPFREARKNNGVQVTEFNGEKNSICSAAERFAKNRKGLAKF